MAVTQCDYGGETQLRELCKVEIKAVEETKYCDYGDVHPRR
jgi:hypothetical protein